MTVITMSLFFNQLRYINVIIRSKIFSNFLFIPTAFSLYLEHFGINKRPIPPSIHKIENEPDFSVQATAP